MSKYAPHRAPVPAAPVTQTRPPVAIRPLRTLKDWQWRYPFVDGDQIEEGLRTDKR